MKTTKLTPEQRASERAEKYARKNNPYSPDGQRAYDEAYSNLYDSVYPSYLEEEEAKLLLETDKHPK